MHGFISLKHNKSPDIYEINTELQDLFLYSGKEKPEIYLDANFRGGISTFANLACKDEVMLGCQKLSNDIESGKIVDIVKSYENTLGDYLFLIATKEAVA